MLDVNHIEVIRYRIVLSSKIKFSDFFIVPLAEPVENNGKHYVTTEETKRKITDKTSLNHRTKSDE